MEARGFGSGPPDLIRASERLEALLENIQRDAAVMPIVAEMNAAASDEAGALKKARS